MSWAVALSLAALSSAAGAEEALQPVPPPGADSAEVRRLLARSIELRAAGDDALAVAVLSSARELAPASLRVRAHLATAYQATGDWLRARELLSQVLAHGDDPYVARHRDRLEAAQREVQSRLALLERERLRPARAAQPPAGEDLLQLRGPALRPPAASSEEHPNGASWLGWGLAGLGAASALTTVGALIYREVHARRWNEGARCLEPGFTRVELCAGERSAALEAERVALFGGALTGLFAVAAVIFAASAEEASAPRVAGVSCTPSAGAIGATCGASF